MGSAQPTTDQPAPSSFDLSSYVAVSRAAEKDEAEPRGIPGAGAAFCAVGALAVVPLTSAHAAIVTKVNTGDMNQIDIGGTDGNDFRITVLAAGWSETFLRVAAANRVGNRAYRSTTNKTVGTGAGMINPSLNGRFIYTGGSLSLSFSADTNNYVPVKFTDALVNGGSTVYGWAQIDVLSNSDIVKVVYSDSGQYVNLNAGVFSEVAPTVPEPSTLALMATGAAGGLALRRRRREQKQGK